MCIRDRVEGEDIRDVTRKSLRTNYGMVLQETWLKSGTIRENIAYGRPDATEDEVIQAAKEAHAHGFITRMPEMCIRDRLWIMVVWVVGALVLGAWMTVVNIRFYRMLVSKRKIFHGKTPGFVTERIYTVEGMVSPCYFGLGTDEAIYLPLSIEGDEEKLRHALAHELSLIHILPRRHMRILITGLRTPKRNCARHMRMP